MIILNTYHSIEKENITLYLKGYVYNNSYLLKIDQLIDLFLINKSLNVKSVSKIVKNFIGQYSIVIETNEYIILISDIIRTYPLFFSINDKVFVSDSVNQFTKEILQEELSNFVKTGYSYEEKTIYNNLYAVQAASIVQLNKVNLTISRYRYFSFCPDGKTQIKKKDFVNTFNKKLYKAFNRSLAQIYLNESSLIVPLSGGHDSRHIINILQKLSVKNVICYSYGKPNSTQAKLSKKVAENVGYEWHFVVHTEEKWLDLHDKGLIDSFVDFSFNGVSSPHLQDFLAIYELMQKGIINTGDVVIPGHTLDMISGGHFSNIDLNCKSKNDAIIRTLKRHSYFYEDILTKKTSNYETLSNIYSSINIEPCHFQEYINWQERQSKFIVNSCRVYEFFGIDFRLPFWDKELVDFFLTLPPEQRIERKFFKSAEREGILNPELAAIPFDDEIELKKKKKNIIDQLKILIPIRIRSYLVRTFGKKEYKAEALNQIYALKANYVEDIIGPIDDFPEDTHDFLKPIFSRPTHRVNYHLLSGLYAVRRAIDKQKENA